MCAPEILVECILVRKGRTVASCFRKKGVMPMSHCSRCSERSKHECLSDAFLDDRLRGPNRGNHEKRQQNRLTLVVKIDSTESFFTTFRLGVKW